MSSGHFSLFGLLAFASHHHELFGPMEKGSFVYGRKVKDLLKGIPNDRGGWYLWGRFNDLGWWETIYLGKAGNRKVASLYGRLSSELRNEAIFVWASVYGKEDTLKQYTKRYKGKFDSDSTRSLRKMGAQFVLWVSAEKEISEDEISRQEKILIRIFRPSHNVVRGEHIEPDEITKQVEDQIERELTIIKGVIY